MDTCVLLQRDGNYHFERHSNGASQVQEGQIPDGEIEKVKAWLDNAQLRDLTNDEIVRPLLITDMELWQFNIFHGPKRQDLVFPGMESMKPFRTNLAPLMEWFNGLRNEAHREIPEDSGRNNCLPPHRVELKVRSNAGAEAAPEKAVTPETPTFLLRWQSESNMWQRFAWRTCAVVYDGGHYRVEKSSQEMRGQVESKVYEGSMNAAQMEGLRHVLAEQNLAESPDIQVPENAIFAASSITSAWIPRGNRIQHLEFASTVAQAAIGSHYEVKDPNMKLVRPVEKWIRSELRADRSTLVKSAVPNTCAAK